MNLKRAVMIKHSSETYCTFLRYMSSNKSIYNYQYLQNSKIPTMHFQKSLPHLPIPKLEDTCLRYLAAQRPLLPNEAFVETEKNVTNFQNSTGKDLHKLLEMKDKQNKHTSYISKPWFDMYLSDRQPLPINYNPVLIFENNCKPGYNTQSLRATNMLISSLRFMKSLRNEILEPEVFHLNPKKSDTNTFRTITSLLPSAVSWYGAYMFNAYPLDMSQYYNLFNSTRIPEIGKDKIFQDTSAKHVLVMRNGNFYTFDVLDSEGNILPADTLLARLQFVLNDKTPATTCPLGILTSENRDTWATVRAHLISIGNEALFRKIDSALFSIMLDDDDIGTEPKRMLKHYLHGTGTNRWFDKSFSLIFTKNGIGGVNFEHSWGDGVAVLRYFQDIYKDSKENPQVHPDTKVSSQLSENDVQILTANVDDKVKSFVDKAIENYNSICKSLMVNYVLTEGIGKNFLKKHSISPDAVMQLGFQMAYYKQYGKFVGSYESCSTAAFKHGRTETIRPCTTDTKMFCEAIHSSNRSSNTNLRNLIQNCSKTHGNLTKEAAMGQGFDRHLFALKLLAQENGLDKIPLYEDPAYAFINHNIISTSTLSSPAVLAGGFGPVVKDGYGIGYIIRDESLGALVTCYEGQRNGSDYVECLKSSYEQIQNILIQK